MSSIFSTLLLFPTSSSSPFLPYPLPSPSFLLHPPSGWYFKLQGSGSKGDTFSTQRPHLSVGLTWKGRAEAQLLGTHYGNAMQSL